MAGGRQERGEGILGQLINGWAIGRLGRRLAVLPGGGEPDGHGDFDFFQGVFGGFATGGTVMKVRHIGYPAGVIVTLEEVDVETAHKRRHPWAARTRA